ncbi:MULTISPECIES: cobalt-precorrin-7 (C(5))-methyltransferase [Metallosphaera]|uniref:Precorrin-6Y C5,15-methyltransferase (Decarboxylating) n=3 Tax=Metallosphaera TaxID=41980 RepID=A4YIJ0_METS5|nr:MULTISPECIES: cobalt-precorrin-7 (C(5))-methyltransferase [Metallosphaera]ABP96242.1 precorrin-6Y C5,15-methyltransferase (decarboxylating) [Metallosphaera sedula DSM 5348]AIM28225.1 precorrin-6Y C5,15-methyltransferase (decarboxylating) [Metallosphaera sedula]AKV75035.1 precorrin-6Y C5,15-methyltransferase [Metallosphaera sedula]AKV77273.1 precorrin-6Y C5,15-methyltransferase [Metallosphaera sedula]AKV79523.1 precorrin-6Y C5,15-methyltransferase [Metallosphaera sedula]
MDYQPGQRNSWPKIIGAGPGSPDYFTLKLVNNLRDARKIIATRRVLSAVRPFTHAELIELEEGSKFYSMIKNVEAEKGTLILSTGDPMIAGIGKFFPHNEIEPGISSIQKCASLIHREITNSAIISIRYGYNYEKVDAVLRLGLSVFLLPEPGLTVGDSLRKLLLYITRPEKMEVSVCLNLSLENERVINGKMLELTDLNDNGLKVIFISPSVN